MHAATHWRMHATPSCRLQRRALGCGDAGCALCQLNPLRKCERQLQKKYLVGDSMHARCGAQIRVSLVDSQGRLLVDGQHSNSELLVGAPAVSCLLWRKCRHQLGLQQQPCAETGHRGMPRARDAARRCT